MDSFHRRQTKKGSIFACMKYRYVGVHERRSELQLSLIVMFFVLVSQDACGIYRQIAHTATEDVVQGIISFLLTRYCFRAVAYVNSSSGVLVYLRRIFDTLGALDYVLDEQQYANHEGSDPWVQHLVRELEEVRTTCELFSASRSSH